MDWWRLAQSLPSRERGLKSSEAAAAVRWWAVAPFTGAWIEICHSPPVDGRQPVAPFTGAWIEIQDHELARLLSHVAPFTGAWIEIDPGRQRPPPCSVAPFTGAWIEINKDRIEQLESGRRSLHGSVD